VSQIQLCEDAEPAIDVEAGAATLVEGIRASVPIVVGYVPIAFSFGVAATGLGFSALEAIFLSVVIYSGASQFMALTLLSGGTAAAVSIVTLLAMNLRHVLYGPSLLDRAGTRAQTRLSWAWAYGLTDEVFATTIGFLAGGTKGWSERWMLGVGAAAFLSWVGGTAVGAFAGSGALAAYPAVEAALGFMLPALFLSLLLAILNRRQVPVVATAGVVCAGVTLATNVTAGILAGMVAGALAGIAPAGPAPAEETV
jgi:4-azaleucine resistance transporter AzlC